MIRLSRNQDTLARGLARTLFKSIDDHVNAGQGQPAWQNFYTHSERPQDTPKRHKKIGNMIYIHEPAAQLEGVTRTRMYMRSLCSDFWLVCK